MIDVATSARYTGDCRALLLELPERSVQTCVTSPPYFGLRDCAAAPLASSLRRVVFLAAIGASP